MSRKTIIPRKGERLPYYEAAYLAKKVLSLVILGKHPFTVSNKVDPKYDHEIEDHPVFILCHGYEIEIEHDGTFPRAICGIYDVDNDTRHYIYVPIEDHFSDYHLALLGREMGIESTDQEIADWKEEFLNLQEKK